MMRKRTMLLLGAGAAAMLTLGGLAGLAQAHMEGGPGGGSCRMGMGRGHGMMGEGRGHFMDDDHGPDEAPADEPANP